MERYTSRGFRAARAAYPSPRPASTPGRKFSMRTSHCSAKRATNSAPAAVRMSAHTWRFPAFICAYRAPMPLTIGGTVRQRSPPGDSILMHLGAQVRQDPATRRAGDDLRQVEDAHTFEGSR